MVMPQVVEARALATKVARELDYVGVLTLEFFATTEGPVFNEMAPRVHNSGHWTIEGALTSQFENHIRAICGLPLGSVALAAAGVEMRNLIGDTVAGLGANPVRPRQPPPPLRQGRRAAGAQDGPCHQAGAGVTREVFLVAAVAENGVIGAEGAMPWHIPADLRRFKSLTMGQHGLGQSGLGLPMVMGRKTFDSLPGLLPGRRHIVLTRDRAWQAEGAEVAHSLEDALALANCRAYCGDRRRGDLCPGAAARQPDRADRGQGGISRRHPHAAAGRRLARDFPRRTRCGMRDAQPSLG